MFFRAASLSAWSMIHATAYRSNTVIMIMIIIDLYINLRLKLCPFQKEDGIRKGKQMYSSKKRTQDDSHYLFSSSRTGMGSREILREAHRSALARASCEAHRKQINVRQDNTQHKTSKWYDRKFAGSHEKRLMLAFESVCQHTVFLLSDSNHHRHRGDSCICVHVWFMCVCAPQKSEHVWMTRLPVSIGLGITGGGRLGSKLYKSNYVSLSLTLSAARLIHARQSAVTKYKLASMIQTAYRIINDKAGANCTATPHMLYS